MLMLDVAFTSLWKEKCVTLANDTIPAFFSLIIVHFYISTQNWLIVWEFKHFEHNHDTQLDCQI